MRYNKILSISCEDIQDYGDQMIVTIEDTKNDYSRQFVIGREYYHIVKKCMTFRPTEMTSSRFFVNYQNGRCTHMFIGKDEIS